MICGQCGKKFGMFHVCDSDKNQSQIKLYDVEKKQTNELRKPWYVRYYLVPDPKKPRTALMGIVHGYTFFWLSLWVTVFFIGGIVGLIMIPSDPMNGLIITFVCLSAAYGGFRFLKRERARDKKRQNHQ